MNTRMRKHARVPAIGLLAAGLLATPLAADTGDSGGTQQGIQVKGEYTLYQLKHIAAEALKFTSYNVDVDINGWFIYIQKFQACDTARGDTQRDINANAWFIDNVSMIVFGDSVNIDVTQWVDTYNTQDIKDVHWRAWDGTPPPDPDWDVEKAMPDHGWSYGFPEETGDGQYRHMFCLSNEEEPGGEFLSIADLQFLGPMPFVESMRNELDFTGVPSEPPFVLPPGGCYEVEVLTDTPAVGEYLYFTYSAIELNEPFDLIVEAWGGHPVVLECPSDFDMSGSVDTTDLLALLAAWGTDDPLYDVEPDGVVNIQDLLVLIASWGAC